MIRVVVCHQQSLAQNCLAVAVRDFCEEIGCRISNQIFDLFQIIAELLYSFFPESFVAMIIGLWPIPFGPFRRNVFRVAAKLQNVPLRDAHVFEHLPGRVRQAFDLLSTQFSRKIFDEVIKTDMRVAGAQIVRPATITDVQLCPGKEQTVQYRNGDGTTRTVRSRWIVDASGVAAILARKHGWWKSNTEHPTAAAWSRWKGVKDWDSRELAEKYPQWSRAVYATRNTATNHVIGDGWWSWWIPLKGGDVSVGVVLDQRLVNWPQDGGKIGERLKAFLIKHPVAREILVDAEFDENDVHWRKNLAYYSTIFAGDGFVLVGDAAAFMDPFYSPGMDWISFTTSRAAALIGAQRRGEPMSALVERHNRDFATSHRCWFEAVYKDKYEYMGEFDLMSTALIFDLCLYYLGVASRPFKSGENALLVPPFSSIGVGRIFRFMRTYNRRFAEIARRRRKRRALGKMNRAHRCLIPGFKLHSGNPKLFLQGFAKWARIEVGELLSSQTHST